MSSRQPEGSLCIEFVRLTGVSVLPPLCLVSIFGVRSCVQSLPFAATFPNLIIFQAICLVGLLCALRIHSSVFPRGASAVIACLFLSFFARIIFLASTRERRGQETGVISRWDYFLAEMCFWTTAIFAWNAVANLPFLRPRFLNTRTVHRSFGKWRCLGCLLSTRLWWTTAFIATAACAYPFFALLPTLRLEPPALWLGQRELVQDVLRMQYVATYLTVPPTTTASVVSPPPGTYISPSSRMDQPISKLDGTIFAPKWYVQQDVSVNASDSSIHPYELQISENISFGGGPWWVSHGTTKARCLLWYSANLSQLVISFGGLAYTEDWAIAFDARSVDWRPSVNNESEVDWSESHAGGDGIVSVNRGFLKLYLSIRNEIRSILRQELGRPPPQLQQLIISGHSMGGVLAQFAALDFLNTLGPSLSRLPVQTAVLLFAPPLGGDASFVSAYDNAVGAGQSVRLYIPTDIVVHILDPLVRGIHGEGWGDSTSIILSSLLLFSLFLPFCQMGPVKGGVAVFPVLDSGTHGVGSLDNGLSIGSASSWVVGRTFVPLIVVLAVIALCTPAWRFLRNRAGLDEPYNSPDHGNEGNTATSSIPVAESATSKCTVTSAELKSAYV